MNQTRNLPKGYMERVAEEEGAERKKLNPFVGQVDNRHENFDQEYPKF